jgi:hypothetical protein
MAIIHLTANIGFLFKAYRQIGKNRPPSNKNKKAAEKSAAFSKSKRKSILLDFAFFVFDVFAYNWVILTNDHFFCHCTCVFLCHIKVTSARGRVQADFDCGWLRHFTSPATGPRPMKSLKPAF